MNSTTQQKVEHLFRHEYGRISALLCARFGMQYLDEIEDAIQDALLKAMRLWPLAETPTNPAAWLYRVATNSLLDRLKKVKPDSLEDLEIQVPQMEKEELSDLIFQDEQLSLIYACCHPKLSASDQIMLCLKLLCGFSTDEIARLLFLQPENAKKSIQRAKARFKERVGSLKTPSLAEIHDRTPSVLAVVYLLFTKGYLLLGKSESVNQSACEEALRFSAGLYQHEECISADLHALMALMLFHYSRNEARTNEAGDLLRLKEQDWSLWDKEMLELAEVHFIRAWSLSYYPGRYLLEAGIARLYTRASSYSDIDWEAILLTYNQLEKINPSASVQLNKVVVLREAKGSRNAMTALGKLEEAHFQSDHIFYSIRADLKSDLGQDSRDDLKSAIRLCKDEREKKILQSRLLSSGEET